MDRKTLITATGLLSVLLIVGAPIAGVAQSKKERNQAKTLQDLGDKAFQQKNFREATDKYSQSIAVIATNPYAHYKKGFAHFNLKESDQALNEFSTALIQGFKPLEIYRIRAFIYYDQKNYDAAIDDIRKGLVLAPNDIQFLKGLGEIYLAKTAYPEALDAFQKASKAAPNDADIPYNMARIYLANGDARSQAASAQAALTKGTRFPGEAFYLLGDADQKLRLAAGAIDAYQKAINAKPDIYLAYINLADVFRNEGRYNDAITTLKQGLRVFVNDGNIYTELSWYYSLADRPDDAVQAAKAGITLLPTQSTAYTNLCRAYNEVKNYDLAISACNSALRLKPGDGETYYYLGRTFDAQGRTADANTAFKRAVTGLIDYTDKNPTYSDGYYLLGNAYLSDRQRDKALEAYQKCLAISPRFVRAKVNLGLIYVFKKDKAAAMNQYNQLLTMDPAYAAKLKAEIDKM